MSDKNNLVYREQLDDNVMEMLTEDIGNNYSLRTENTRSIVKALNEINGKDIISNAVGSPLLTTDTFEVMGEKIKGLSNSFRTALLGLGISVSSLDKFERLIEKLELFVDENASEADVDAAILESLKQILINNGIEIRGDESLAELVIKVGEGFESKSGLDIIIATELPDSAIEGQLCIITNVNTDKITMSREKPVLTDSEIYIKCYDEPTFYEFTVKNGAVYIKVNIRYITQYINGEEISLRGYIYSNNGTWTPLIPEEFYLFKAGEGLDSSVTYTTDMVRSGININDTNGKNAVTATTSNVKMQTRSASACYTEGIINFNNVNLTGYDYLHVDFQSLTTNNNLGSSIWNLQYVGLKIQICDLNGNSIISKTLTHGYDESDQCWKITRNITKFDISSLEGEYTIKLVNDIRNSYEPTVDVATYIYNLVLGPEVLSE